MADKMMRIAGRSATGIAKPLNVTDDGFLKTTGVQKESFVGHLPVNNTDTQSLLGLKQYYAIQGNNGRVRRGSYFMTGDGHCLTANPAGDVFYASQKSIIKVNSAGIIVWEKDFTSISTLVLRAVSMVYDENAVYISSVGDGEINGRITKLDASTGEVLWQTSLADVGSFGAVYKMVVVSGFIYGTRRNEKIIKLNKISGIEQTSIVVEGASEYSEIVTDGINIYVSLSKFTGTTKMVVKIDTSTDTEIWSWASEIAGRLWALIFKNGYLYALNSGDKTLFKISTDGAIVDSVVSELFTGDRFRFSMQNNLYINNNNKLIKVDLDKFEIVYTLDNIQPIDSLFETSTNIFVYHTDGTVCSYSTDLVEKGVAVKESNVVSTYNKHLNGNGKLKIYETYNGYKVIAMLHDSYLVQKDGNYFVLLGGWEVNPQQITLPTGTVKWINFVEDKYNYWEKSRYRLVANIGDKLYYNYADTSEKNINTWAECNVWGLPNTLHPSDTTTKEYKGKVRPKYYLPPTSTDPFQYMGGMQHYRVGADWDANYSFQDSLWFATYTQTATPMSVFMTKNGKDIYCEYMYGINRTPSRIGQNIDLSAISGTIPNDLKLRKITPIVPNAENKEPTDVFSFGAEVAVSNMTYASGKTTVTASAHGLATGDVIHFKSVSTSDNAANWLKPTSYTALLNNNVTTAWTNATTPPMGNGKIYQVTKLTNDTFTLHEAVGNPHNQFYCTHIHSLDVVPNGIVISTGEAGELSNITFLGGVSTLNYLPANQQRIFADYAQVHLTANPVQDITGSVQRPLGFYMEEDFYLFASDEQTYRRPVILPEGRTRAFNFRSSGIYKGKLSEIDDWSKAKVVLQPQYVAFLFKKIGDVFITTDVSGDTYFSVDKGDNWNKLYTFPHTVTKYGGASADSTEFVIDGYYFKVH